MQLPLSVYESEDALELPSVFFVPDYEIHYYKGLRHMAVARKLPEQERPAHYERALRHWQEYVAAGEPQSDRWLTQARLHAGTCRRLLDEVRQQRKPAKRKPAPRDEATEPQL